MTPWRGTVGEKKRQKRKRGREREREREREKKMMIILNMTGKTNQPTKCFNF